MKPPMPARDPADAATSSSAEREGSVTMSNIRRQDGRSDRATGRAPADRPNFGRFRLLGRIGEGGMAEVYRAVMTGPEGFERELVLKRILPAAVGDRRLQDDVHPRGEDLGAARSPEHRPDLRVRRGRRRLLHRDGERAGRDPARGARHPAQGPARDAAHGGGRRHPPDLHRARLRPRAARSRRGAAGDRPPGRLAHQHHAGLQRHGEDPRLRDRARGLVRRGGGQEGAHQGQGQLPVARADPRAAVRRARRRVRAGGRVPRDADRPAAVPGQERHLAACASCSPRRSRPLGAERGHPARARSHRHARAGARSRTRATSRPATWPPISSAR